MSTPTLTPQDRALYSGCVIAVVVLLLYLLGFNEYVPPQNGDDVVYYHGAISLADGHGYQSQGQWIRDWPPVQSTLVAAVMRLTGSREYFLAKVVNLLAVLLSLLLAHRLMVREHRNAPLLACLAIAISPTSLLTGTAGQADFTFFALSMVFFLLLGRLRAQRKWRDAFLCGVVLGLASLTRWQGVLLGVGLVHQACWLWESGNRRALSREALSAVLGAAMVLGWVVWLKLCGVGEAAAISNYEFQGATIWWRPAPLELGAEILNVFTQFENVVYKLYPDGSWVVGAAAALFWGLLAHGFYLRVKGHGLLASDVYVQVTLVLYLFYAYKEARYAIPLAPFLLDYLFSSLQVLLRSRWVRRVGIVCWLSGLLAIDGVLLFYGDGGSTGPRCQLLLSDERDFLRGHYLDLYDTCQEIKRDHPHAVLACDKFHTRIVRHYTGLETHYPGYAPDKEFDLFVSVEGLEFSDALPEILKAELETPRSLEGRLHAPEKRGRVVVWEVR